MESPYLPKSIFGADFEHVYEPAEDTYLLIDALERDLDELKKDASVCLELGSGSGTVMTALSKSLDGNLRNRFILATDISMRACQTSLKCARYHGQNHIQVIRTDLAEAILDRLENFVDLLVFNPPYVPTTQDEIQSGSERPIYLSWAGGEDGRALTNRFLERYVPKLLRKPNGVAYLVAVEQNRINQLQTFLVDHGIWGSVAIHRRAGTESLSVIKYAWINN